MLKNVTDTVFYVGVDDKDIDLFENQYIVPNGIAYNSYVIMDEKIAIMDMVDAKCADQWFANVAEVLGDRQPDYLIISHLEPDHSANLGDVLAKYPDIKIVSNAKLFAMLPNFFEVPVADRSVTVAEGQTLSLGSHTLQFFMAPMVHWPEVMVTYEQSEKILFSADAFGKFGTLDTDEDWACEARRYYFNIVGKYGMPAQALLKKAAGLDIQKICALHGPILTENLEYYIGKYQLWSTYTPEDEGIFIAYCSLHGNTEKAAKKGVLGILVLVFMISSSCKCCSMVGRKNKKPLVTPAGWQKRRKAENPPRYHSSLFPLLETHSTGYHHIPASVTGAPVCVYLGSTQPLYSQFGSLIALCLAPTGTSLRGSPCLLLCVIAFVMVA